MLKTLSVTAPIFILIALGFAATRTEFLSKANIRVLGVFVITFSMPALLFKSLSQRPITEIVNIGYLAAYALGSLTVMAVGFGVARFGRKKSLSASALYAMGMSCSNSGFVAYPIALQMVGPTAAVALALNMIVENMLLLPLALVVAEAGIGETDPNRGEPAKRRLGRVILKSLIGLFKNPMILGIIAGFAFSLFALRMPDPILRSIDMLALSATSVALFVIGGTLVGLETRGIIGDITQIVSGKLLLHPLAVFVALMLFPGIDPKLKVSAMVAGCVPMLSIYPILGQRFREEGLCAAALMTATVLSFFTISTVLWMISASGVFLPAD